MSNQLTILINIESTAYAGFQIGGGVCISSQFVLVAVAQGVLLRAVGACRYRGNGTVNKVVLTENSHVVYIVICVPNDGDYIPLLQLGVIISCAALSQVGDAVCIIFIKVNRS